MLKMKNSGHKQNFRTQILKSSLNAFEKMLEEDKVGTMENGTKRVESKLNKIK